MEFTEVKSEPNRVRRDEYLVNALREIANREMSYPEAKSIATYILTRYAADLTMEQVCGEPNHHSDNRPFTNNELKALSELITEELEYDYNRNIDRSRQARILYLKTALRTINKLFIKEEHNV